MSEPLVRLRCGVRGCRQVLAEFSAPPATWDGTVRIHGCRRHGGIRGAFSDEVLRRHAKGLPPTPRVLVYNVAWRQLRPLFTEAATRGRTVEDTLKP